VSKILVITSQYPPHHYGGYETTCRDVVERWRRAGHSVHVLASNLRLAFETADSEPETGVTRALHLYWDDHVILHPTRRTRLRWERANQRALREALARHLPDVVSVWHMGALSLALVDTIVENTIPIVFNIHDDWLVYAPQMDAWTRMFRKRPLLGRLVRRITGVPTHVPDFASAGAFCFVSEATRKRAEKQGYRFPVVGVVWNGIDPDVFTRTGTRTDWRWGLLYAGRLDSRKGVDTVIRALALLPDASLVIAGRGDEEYAAELRQLAASIDVSSRVTFTVLSREELVRAYADADVVVFPSRWEEPFGLVPLEAMACGTPVVATGTGGSGEFCLDGRNCLLFRPDDVTALAAQVRRLADEPVLRRRLVEGGAATARELTIDRLAEELEAWHVAAAAGYPAGAPPQRVRPLAELSRP
jgi:glycogen synthase